MESAINPKNFVRIAQGISTYGTIIFSNFVKYTISWHTPEPIKVKFGTEKPIMPNFTLFSATSCPSAAKS